MTPPTGSAEGNDPPDDHHRTCRRCGNTPERGSWTCRHHAGDTSTEPDPRQTEAKRARWARYWQTQEGD